MATLYVTEPGARLEKEHQRLLVTRQDKVLFAAPLRKISEVVLVGYCGATTPAMLALLDHNIGLTLLRSSGQLRGRLAPPLSKNVFLRQQQYLRAAQPDFCLGVARQIVRAKLLNCRVMAMRVRRSLAGRGAGMSQLDEISACVSQLGRLNLQCAQIESLDKLRGLEGLGARVYFRVIKAGLRWGEGAFETRSRRPPKNPVNALLSLCYTLLLNSVYAAIEIADLDPYAGFYHARKYGRPALALDLMEEFRPVIADAVVLAVINRGALREADFSGREGVPGVWLSRRGLKKLLRYYGCKINRKIYHPSAGRALSMQKILEVQANCMKRVIKGEEGDYRPLIIR